MGPRDSASYIKRVTAKSGVTYFYFKPPLCMADHPQAGRSLGNDERAALAAATALVGRGTVLSYSAPTDEAMAKYLREAWREARGRAKRKGLSFTISNEFVSELMERQQGYCAVSGLLFSLEKHEGAYHRPFVPSIDRIDSSKGYDVDNVQLVCMAVNIGRGAWGDTVFSAVIRGARRVGYNGNVPTG